MFADPRRGSAPAIRARRSVRHSGAHSSAAQSPAGGLVREHRATQTAVGGVARLGDGAGGIVAGDVGHPDRAGPGANEQKSPSQWLYAVYPARVSAGSRARERRAHGGAEEDLGVDAVDVLVVDADGRGAHPPGRGLVEAGGRSWCSPRAGGRRRVGERHDRPPLPSKTSKSASSVRSSDRRPIAELGGRGTPPTWSSAG